MKISDIAMASSSSPPPPPSSSSSPESTRVGTIGDLCLGVGPVRRNLFGPVDHQQLQLDFQRLLSINVEVANQRWSYDFRSDRPKPGAEVEWEELSCQEVPAFYRSCLMKRGGAGGARAIGGVAKWMTDRRVREESPASSGSSGEEYLEVTTRGSYRLQRPEKRTASQKAARRRQAAITDFFSVKKRRLLHKHPSRQ